MFKSKISDNQGPKSSKALHSNLDIENKSVRPFLYTILNNSLYQM